MTNFVLKKEIWLPIIILIVAGSFIYSFNLNNELFWDDNDWILNNDFVHELSWSNIKFWLTHNTLAGVGLQSNYYRPFLFFTFALNYVISGTNPFGYHLLSNLIHIANGILVFSILYLVFRRKLLAFLTSLIFLVHPLQTEAITYIAGRGDVLVTMFMLASLLLFYLAESKNKDWLDWRKILSLVFLVLALLSRETGIIFPVLILAFYIAALSPDRFIKSVKAGLIKTWPYFGIVFIYGILRLTVLNFQNTLNFYAEPNIYSENLYVRFFTFLPILWGYIKLLFVPTGLHMERSINVYTSLFQWPVWLVATGVFCSLYFVYRLYRKKNPGMDYNIWLLGLSWFFIALGPVSGITPINALMYEHWLYLPMIGFWLIVSFYLVRLFDYLKKDRKYLFVICVLLFGAYVSFFCYQSVKRNILWGDEEKFYMDILKYEPASSRINNNLGNLYFNNGDIKNAEIYYRKATEVGDVFAEPYYNLGTILQSKGDIYGAIQLYEKAIEINPGFYYPYQNLSVIYAQQGDLTKAIENIETLKLLLPNNPRVYYNSALIYIVLNNKEQVLMDLRAGLKYADLDPQTSELIKELIEKLQN